MIEFLFQIFRILWYENQYLHKKGIQATMYKVDWIIALFYFYIYVFSYIDFENLIFRIKIRSYLLRYIGLKCCFYP